MPPPRATPPSPPRRPPPEFFHARWWFSRLLGIVYLAAFGALLPQLAGLLGPSGLEPAIPPLRVLGRHGGPLALLAMPSLLWLDPDFVFLATLCAGGVAAALLLLSNTAPRLAAAACWCLYLSVVAVGRDFFAYQWDALLLEAGFLAVFLAPGGLLPGKYRHAPSSWAFVGLGRLLLVKLLLGSALGKLLNGDPAWREGTALNFFFETQPLPTALAWWAHHLPSAALHAATRLTVLVELLAPLLIFGPRRLRPWVAGGYLLWFALVSLTGNHAFLPLLAMALCLLLVEDAAWPGRRRKPGAPHPAAAARARGKPWWRLVAHGAVVAVMALLSLTAGLRPFLPGGGKALGPVDALLTVTAPFRVFNRYGMFTTITRRRREIVIEGSLDGDHWTPYEFRWKPGVVFRAPGFVAPFQPRLDWQMWFAALTPYADDPWFDRLLDRLLTGDPAVLNLLGRNPFPLWPPREVRAVLYEYHFTSPEERRRTGNWWWRKRVGLYAPPRSLPPDEQPPALPPGVIRT